MTDVTPRVHSSAAEVTRALLDIKPASDKFSIFADRYGRIRAYWFLADEGSTLNFMVYRIELFAETGEYKSVMFEDAQPKVQNSWIFSLVGDPYAVPFSYTSTDTDLSGPVDRVLAAHGWTRKRSAARVFFAKLFGRA